MSEGRALVIVEDDAAFARTLRRSFERRGYRVRTAESLETLRNLLAEGEREGLPGPGFAVVDLKLGGGSGLACVQALRATDAAMRIVVLTGFASIATAVEAIKLGASDYLAKPATTDEIEAAFERGAGDPDIALGTRPSSIKTLEWEHIHQVLVSTDFNISEAARRLGMHRRTLARKLEKRHLR